MQIPRVILRTPRCTLRHLVPGDAAMMLALHGDPDVMRYLPDKPFASLEAAREFLVSYQDVYRNDGFARWAVVEDATGECVGWCGLRRMPDGDIDIGYRFFKSAWGRGLATETAKACLEYGFRTLGLKCIVGRADVGNIGSRRVLEKIGMTYECNETSDWLGEVALFKAVAPAGE